MANAYNILHAARTISERLDLIKPILLLYFYCHKTHKRKKTIKYNKKKQLLVSFPKTIINLSPAYFVTILYIRVLYLGDYKLQ